MVENPAGKKSSCPDCSSLLWTEVIFEIALAMYKKWSTNQQKANISFEKKESKRQKRNFSKISPKAVNVKF